MVKHRLRHESLSKKLLRIRYGEGGWLEGFRSSAPLPAERVGQQLQFQATTTALRDRKPAELGTRRPQRPRERHKPGSAAPRLGPSAGPAPRQSPRPAPAARGPPQRRLPRPAAAGAGGGAGPGPRGAAGAGSARRRRGGGGTHVLCTCRSISRISVNLSRRSMGSCSITAGTRRGGEEGGGRSGRQAPAAVGEGGGRRFAVRGSPPPRSSLLPPSRSRPLAPGPQPLTLQVVLQIQHGGGRASAQGLLARGGSSLPRWRRRQQHPPPDSAKTTLAADGARPGRAAIGCPRP